MRLMVYDMTTFENFGQANKFSGHLTTPETGTVIFSETPWYTYNESKVRPSTQWLAYETHPRA